MSGLSGAAYLVRGLRLIIQPGIRHFAVIPALINMGLFVAVTVLLFTELDRWVNGLMPTLPHWLQWLDWLIRFIVSVAAVVLSFFTVSLAANLIAAPFNEVLAARVERFVTGSPPAEHPASWMSALSHAVMNQLRKLRYFAVRAAPLLLLYLIPGVNAAAPLLWLLFSAWMMAVEYVDYPMGNHGLGFTDQRRVLAANRLLALGFGGTVLTVTAVPLINFIVMPAAVAGATVMWVEKLSPRA
jgi:CysZ protein